MHVAPRNTPTSWLALILLTVASTGLALYIISGLNGSAALYGDIQNELQKPVYSGSVKKVTFPGSQGELNIPSWSLFQDGNIWTLVSEQQFLKEDFTPVGLVTVSVPQGDAGSMMQISDKITGQLTRLFTAAEESGYPLMVSSAYRSIADQQALYEQFVSSRGQEEADKYVADPGSSEHHTGLSVDLSDESESCAADSDRCLIAPATSQWLAENAHRYGFIVRYPEGAQPITGVAYEPWHYRYVGMPLATKIYESGLTLDEALIQMRPAFIVTR